MDADLMPHVEFVKRFLVHRFETLAKVTVSLDPSCFLVPPEC